MSQSEKEKITFTSANACREYRLWSWDTFCDETKTKKFQDQKWLSPQFQCYSRCGYKRMMEFSENIHLL